MTRKCGGCEYLTTRSRNDIFPAYEEFVCGHERAEQPGWIGFIDRVPAWCPKGKESETDEMGETSETSETQPAVAGLDPSLTSFGVAIWRKDDAKPETWAIKSKPRGHALEDRVNRCSDVIDQVVGFLDLYRPQIIVIEGYAFGAIARDRNGKQIVQRGHYDRAELRGLLNADLLCSEYVEKIYEVNPVTLKAFIFKGNAKKNEIVDRVYSEWGINAPTTDEADAAGCAKMARVVAGWDEVADDRQEAAMKAMLRV